MKVTMPGITVADHLFTVPLDHADPGGRTIRVFAREISDPAVTGDLPWALFLQGGPGGMSPRPTGPGYWRPLLATHRVLLLDQRGTGRSTPVTPSFAASLPAEDLAAYLRHFRADAIVDDCELIRKALGVGKWETWGQSYGGFITLTYLSRAPEGLKACHVTGGLPGLDATADDVYTRTYDRVRGKVRRHYLRYPEDEAAARRIAEHLAGDEVLLPDGDRLTVERFRTLGMKLGMGDGHERLHWQLTEAWDGDRLADPFLYEVMTETGFVGNPLYAVLHELIYAQGEATRWAAERLLPADFKAFGTFTGEMIYLWMFDAIRALRPFKGAAELLAESDDWPPLYDPDRLAANDVPVAAVVYHDDMFVDAGLSLQTAERVGNLRVWVTNEFEHDGFRAAADQIVPRLMRMVTGPR